MLGEREGDVTSKKHAARMIPAGDQNTRPSLVDTISALRTGQRTPSGLVQELLARAQINADLNGFITLDAAGVRAAARSAELGSTPLCGVPLVIKDNIHVAGLPNTAGTPSMRSFVPSEDAPCVRRLRAAGATILGKTNMHELAFGISSDNRAFGPVRNPYRRSCFAGGSSGGTAALIAAGVAPAGLGTDTGGSVRIPAALTGLCGFRPSLGRYPGEGVTPLSSTRDTVGPIAHTVSDIILLDAILAGLAGGRSHYPTRRSSSLRLGVPSQFTEPLADEVADLWERAVSALRASEAAVVSVDAKEIIELNQAASLPIVLREASDDLAWYLGHYHTGLDLGSLIDGIASPDVREIFLDGVLPGSKHEVTDAAYAAALADRKRLQRAYRQILQRGNLDALIFPATPKPALDLSEASTTRLAGRSFATFALFVRNTEPSSVAGQPSLTVPMGSTAEGLPVGLCMDGRQGQDTELLEVGLVVENILRYGPRQGNG